MVPRTIRGRNVNHVLSDALWNMHISGEKANSRNGPVIRYPGPVSSLYDYPMERLVFRDDRDANHVFHLMETIWMFAGQADVTWLLQFNSKFDQYAEDNIQWGAYGRRWRSWFNIDQLSLAVEQLKIPNNRRVVIGMWDPSSDLGSNKKDVPCNTHIYLQNRPKGLEMTVCCRSNDMIWGAYGANVVHFSMLQELIARELKAPVAGYLQFSNDFHLYTEFGPGGVMMKNLTQEVDDPYSLGCATVPLIHGMETMAGFLQDCRDFVEDRNVTFNTFFMDAVALPLKRAYLERKNAGKWDTSMIPECDWKLAFERWAARRSIKNDKSE